MERKKNQANRKPYNKPADKNNKKREGVHRNKGTGSDLFCKPPHEKKHKDKLKEAAEFIMKENLAVKPGEKVLIITDKKNQETAKILGQAAKKITKTKMMTIPTGEISGQELPKKAAEELKKCGVFLIPTTISYTHTKAVKQALNKGARGATMAGINKKMMERTIITNYQEMHKESNKLKQELDHGKTVRVKTDTGTDITLSIEGRKAIASAGNLKEKGSLGNLPAGETYIAPLERTADGKIVIDGCVLGQKIKEPMTVIVKEGYAVEFHGPQQLRRHLEKVKDKNAFNIAELGIGTNKKAMITGNTLESEKAKGTCHFAFGNNKNFGGKTDVPIHKDAILRSPTIIIDGKTIIKRGKIL